MRVNVRRLGVGLGECELWNGWMHRLAWVRCTERTAGLEEGFEGGRWWGDVIKLLALVSLRLSS